jgi:putative flippase GtrA
VPSPTARYDHRRSISRYIGLGAVNTALTFVIFTGLQHVTAVAVAYTTAFAIGLVFSTALSARVVFGAPTTGGRRAAFAACYVAIYGVGLAVSHALHGHAAPWMISAATIAVTAPLGYLAGRAVLVRQSPGTRRSP